MYQTKCGALKMIGVCSARTIGSFSAWSSCAVVSRTKWPCPSSRERRMKLRRSTGGGSGSPFCDCVWTTRLPSASGSAHLKRSYVSGCLRHAGEQGGLGRGEQLEVRDAEVDLGRGSDPVGVVAVVDLVEVRGEDALLALFAGIGARQVAGLEDLLDLADPLVALDHFLGEQPRAHELLRDRRCAAIADAREVLERDQRSWRSGRSPRSPRRCGPRPRSSRRAGPWGSHRSRRRAGAPPGTGQARSCRCGRRRRTARRSRGPRSPIRRAARLSIWSRNASPVAVPATATTTLENRSMQDHQERDGDPGSEPALLLRARANTRQRHPS